MKVYSKKKIYFFLDTKKEESPILSFRFGPHVVYGKP